MRIVLGITMRNEVEYGPHVSWQLDDALEMDYDDIVVLDDGSTDGTWSILKEYESKNKRVHVFKNTVNSIKDKNGTNRWMTLLGHMSKFNPAWINVRAADQIYSIKYKKHMRMILEWFWIKKINVVKFPLAHLWRSEFWYRADDVWGNDLWSHNKTQLWRYESNYSYSTKYRKALLHQGRHVPTNFGFRGSIKYGLVNNYLEDSSYGRRNNKHFPLIVLHYGHTTHEKKEAKFKMSMEVAGSGNSIGMPASSSMPPPKLWLRYNGYKGFHEFNIKLEQAPAIWFGSNYIPEPIPEIKSFYPLICQYNKRRADEYRDMFRSTFGRHP